ncbi:MAG TPA: S8 family serine peptidase, partial [Solirubrobacterales bacterium]|nr:S8 family serine peptidase [Solirubrobacterales bacterium]
MPRLLPPLIAVLLALLTSAPSAIALQDRPAPPRGAPTAETVRSPDRVIVQWTASADRGDKVAARAEAEVAHAATLGDPDFQLVKVRPGQSPRDAVADLEANPAVAVAERDSYVSTNAVPDDPLFNQLWGLRNEGLGIGGVVGAVAGADIDAAGAWERTVGDPAVVVADIDSGYRFEHPDLADVAWTNPDEVANGLDDDGNGIADDLHGADFIGPNGEAPGVDGNPTDGDLISGGHGVHTAGTIGAEGDNGIGITGTAQDVRIMPLRACSRFPALEASRCSVASIVAAINYAGEEGARVANMSLGGTGALPQTEANALAANPHVLFVVSAGNDGEDNDEEPRYPCNIEPQLDASPPVPGAIDNVVCVAATDQADGLAGFSDWGATSVDLGAPGTETLSTYPFVTPLAEDFESAGGFATAWPATGADGGFERTDEAPLASFGMTDAIGAPVADTVRETTSAAFTVPPNGGCRLTQTRRVVLGATSSFRYSVLLDGEELAAATPGNTASAGLERRFLDLPAEFKAGGSVQVRFRFSAGA